MDNRTIIAVVLIVLLWSGYSLFFAPVQQTSEPQDPVIAEDISSSESKPVTLAAPDDQLINNFTSEEKNTIVSSEKYDITISSRGATIKKVSFKNYKETNKKDSEDLLLLNSEEFIFNSFKTSFTDGFVVPERLNYKLLDHSKDFISLNNQSVLLTFVAEYENFSINKIYTFYPDKYSFDLTTTVTNTSEVHYSGKYNLTLVTPWSDDEKSDFYSFSGPLTYDGNKLHEDKPKNIQKNPVIYRDFLWSGFTDKYFLQALNPDQEIEQILINYQSGSIENIFTSNSFVLLPGDQKTFEHIAYLGPKKLEDLSAADASFEEAVHFGFFHFLAKPLFVVLLFFYGFLNNYGFAIILLTVCIKLIFWPLTQKSYKSMQGMQKLQPEMKRLKEKYADDKQRLNQEMMSFYRDNKVNPLGGCLPILIQIPVFFSLYKVLLDSIELRHAPFMLWITDLSAKDPLFITPVIMGASMFLQQKLTPTNLDPTQEKVMLMMPVVFTFLFLNFPAGLVIYWLVNNLLTILQQLLIRRQSNLT